MLNIYNTLTGRKEPFKPLIRRKVRMYVCGVTVYDECHLGHARSALVFDVIRRYLEFSGFSVIFVKNFTDVDDKIIKRANDLGIPWKEVTSRYIKAYYRDMKRLGIKRATKEPKATTHMAEIIKLVRTLTQKGVAYQVNGDVYFQVEKFPAYGKLSKRKLGDLQAGARVEVDERKRHPMDFALWKGAKPGEPAWKSPWGQGRPGWHIECSAMAMKHLGKTFDIHGGGADLIFPHHENEIAQSCAATGKDKFANYWLHNGFVQINQEKMSKSLGNFFTIREIFEKWGYREAVTAEVLRYFLISTHYRSPLDFSDQGLDEAKRALDGFYGLFQRLGEASGATKANNILLRAVTEQLEQEFSAAMDDDFNTSTAIAAFQRFRGEVNKLLGAGLSQNARQEALSTYRNFGRVLGIFQVPNKEWPFKITGSGALSATAATGEGHGTITSPVISESEIEQLIADRNEVRKHKNFTRADEIRKTLAEKGITLEDRPDGTTRWKR
jgi:cysteinyl-tRNA synthetase